MFFFFVVYFQTIFAFNCPYLFIFFSTILLSFIFFFSYILLDYIRQLYLFLSVFYLLFKRLFVAVICCFFSFFYLLLLLLKLFVLTVEINWKNSDSTLLYYTVTNFYLNNLAVQNILLWPCKRKKKILFPKEFNVFIFYK